MNIYPKITIITACFNHEKYIGETIESVLSQGYPNLEYIVINDGSTDGSERVIQKYADKLTYFETWEGYRKTVATALNRGFERSTGEIMGWINSDDLLLPRSLFVVAEIFAQHQKVEWITGVATTLNHQSNIVQVHPYRKNIYDYLSGNWSVIQQESTFFRRSLWEKAGGKLDDSYIQAFDSELWSRFFLHAEHYHVNTVLGAYRLIGQSRSIRAKDEFTMYTERALAKMRATAQTKDIAIAKRAAWYRRVLRHVLKLLPNSIYFKLPIAKEYNYKMIEYNFADDRWEIREKNPFRPVY
ncbi:MAG: glycosyltransferase [Candidatus Magasanikbacteria bacterium]|nr:glycosyltransferase [Candidatus Magasanikbacteria bacterium]